MRKSSPKTGMGAPAPAIQGVSPLRQILRGSGTIVDKALRGLTTVNLRSLRFSSAPLLLRDYLRDLETVYHSYAYAPLEPVEMPELVGKDLSPSLFLPLGYIRPGSTPLPDLAAMAALTQKKRPKQIFEIGTFEGLTATVFIKNAGSDAFLHTLDLPPGRNDIPRTKRSYEAHSISAPYVSGFLIDAFGIRQQVQAHWGDSAVFDFQPYRNAIDLFFVDGAHTEDYVALDSSRAFECQASEGWVLWHYCFTPQLVKVLKQIAQTKKIYQIRGTNLALAMGQSG